MFSEINIHVRFVQQVSIQEAGQQKMEEATENAGTVAKDPHYARYLKMVQVVSWF